MKKKTKNNQQEHFLSRRMKTLYYKVLLGMDSTIVSKLVLIYVAWGKCLHLPELAFPNYSMR